jgi:hypothetical protein
VRALVSGPDAQRLLGLRFVHPECSALVGSSQLRALLGVQEFSPHQVLALVRRVCEVGAPARCSAAPLPVLASSLCQPPSPPPCLAPL